MFHCLVIKVVRCQLFATACLLYHIFQTLSRTFFKSFWGFSDLSKVVCFCRSVQATWILYHKFSRLSTVNLNILKTNSFFSISEAIPCDSLFNIPLPQGEVKHFLQKLTIIFMHYFYATCFYTTINWQGVQTEMHALFSVRFSFLCS